jgi:hypothetical protein
MIATKIDFEPQKWNTCDGQPGTLFMITKEMKKF